MTLKSTRDKFQLCVWIFAAVIVMTIMSSESSATVTALTKDAPNVFIKGDPITFDLTIPEKLQNEPAIMLKITVRNYLDDELTLYDKQIKRGEDGFPAPIRITTDVSLPLGWFQVDAVWTATRLRIAPINEITRIAHLAPLDLEGREESNPFGVGTYLAMRFNRKDAEAAAAQMRLAGLTWNRDELLWDIVETKQGEWTWDKTDMAVETCRKNGIHILGLLDYWGTWSKARSLQKMSDDERAQNRDKFHEESIPLYANYCREVVKRYKPGGEFAKKMGWKDGYGITNWEVWNEPATFWDGSPEMFGKLTQAAHKAIKEADPEAVVFFANAGEDFDAKAIGVMGMDSFEGVCPHYYCPPRAPEEGHLDLGMRRTIDFFRDRGFEGEFWISESGWHSRGTIPGMTRQAAFLVRQITMARAVGMDKFLWYNFRNDGPEGSTDTEHQFGLVFREDLSPKPGYAAYANLIRRLGESIPIQRVEVHPEVRIYTFSQVDKLLAVLWSTGNEGSIEDIDIPKFALYDMMGNELDNFKSIPLSGKPVFIETNGKDTKSFVEVLSKATLVNFAPVKIDVKPIVGSFDQSPPVKVNLENFGNETIKAKLSFKAPDGWKVARSESPLLELKPGITTFTYVVSDRARNADNRYPARFALANEKGEEIASVEKTFVEFAVTKGEAKIDGDLSDWKGEEVRWLHLDSPMQAVGLEPYMDWNLSSDFALRWNENGLYFAATVTDNNFSQPHEKTFVWMGDNFQLGFGYPPDEFNHETKKWNGAQYSYGLSHTNNGSEVWCWVGEGRNESIQNDIPLTVKRVNEHTTIYEAFFPAASLTPLPMKSGEMLRFNALLNDNDGGGRRGWLEFTQGIGTGFNPALFYKFTLE